MTCRNVESQHAAVQQQRVLIPSTREGKQPKYLNFKIIVKSTISAGKCQVSWTDGAHLKDGLHLFIGEERMMEVK